jgi:hypothetical protein
VNLWKPQNVYFQLLHGVLPDMKGRGDEKSKVWIERFVALGDKLGFHSQHS